MVSTTIYYDSMTPQDVRDLIHSLFLGLRWEDRNAGGSGYLRLPQRWGGGEHMTLKIRIWIFMRCFVGRWNNKHEGFGVQVVVSNNKNKNI